MFTIVRRVCTLLSLITGAFWLNWYLRGRQFALRDRLTRADAIVVLAGARGNIKYLEGKIQTARDLYRQGWAPTIICTGRFSVAFTETPKLIPLEELEEAVAQGRIQAKDLAVASKKWDEGFGARFMKEQLVAAGLPETAVIAEDRSLHTRENAEYVAALMKEKGMSKIILVTSPFHQLRTYLTFLKVFQRDGFTICNYYAETGEWHPLTWFLSTSQRQLVKSEQERILTYRAKGDLL